MERNYIFTLISCGQQKPIWCTPNSGNWKTRIRLLKVTICQYQSTCA